MKRNPDFHPGGWAVIQRALDRASPELPKFRRFENAVRDSILDGSLPPGMRLPPEKSVAEFFGLSLGTAQKAMSSLERDGYVVRARRRGTFVAARQVSQEEIYIFRFKDPATGQYIAPLIRMLSIGEETEDGPWRDFLRAERITRIDRLMRIGLEPPVYSEFYIDRDYGADLMDRPLEEMTSASLHRLLAEEFRIPTIRAEHRLHCALFADIVCDHLMLPSGTSGMVWDVGGYTHADKPTSFQRIHLPMGHRPVEIEAKI